MPLTPNLGLDRPIHGAYPDSWDNSANSNYDKIDAAFAALGIYDLPIPGTGHAHDGTAGQGPKIRHQDLNGAGVLTHAQLETAAEKVKVTGVDTTPDYLSLKLVAGANITLNVLNPGANEQLEIVSTGGGSPWVAADEYGAKHAVPTSASVAYTDNFNYPPQTPLRDCDYVRSTTGIEFYSTGYSAAVYVDPTKGDLPTGQYAATVACHIPHGHAQRVTLSLTEFDYSGLEVGDSIEFTLALHSTHTLGAHLPQQIGVVLDLQFAVVAPGPVFQVTHKIFILPNAVDKILLFECHTHANPDDIKGCWELSMDSNGHVYHYWRRNLIYSSQTLPNSMPGPVAAYFAALAASLTALGEPKYGAMGFGMQYAISMFSKFNLEARWLSVTSDCDVYDEVPPACPGPLPPIGTPVITPLPKEFWFVVPGGQPGGVPGAQCCVAPVPVNVGDVLAYDSLGNPDVWVTGCNVIPIDYDPLVGPPKGFSTNKSWDVCFPCDAPSGTPVFFNPPTDWPKEGTTGAIIVHGISPLPPYIEVISSSIGFVIVDVVWLNWWEFLLKYIILDGYAGTAVTITVRNKYVPAISFLVNPFVTITNSLPIISSITWLDTYEATRTLPTEGFEFDATITGTGFDVGCVLTSPTPGVTIVSFNRISDSEIDAVIKFDYDMGTSAALVVTNPDGHTDSETLAVAYTPPVVSYPTLAPDTLIAPGKTFQIIGNFFSPGVAVTLSPAVPPGTINNFVFLRISQTLIQGTFDVIGGLGAQVDLDIADVARGASVTMPLFQVGDVAAPTIAGTVVDPTPVYNGGVQNPYEITANGLNHGSNAYMLIAGPYVNGEVYGTPGDIHTTSTAPAQTKGEFRAWCIAGPGFVNVQIVKPGVGSALAVAAFPTAVPPAPLLAPVMTWSAGLEPGAAGVMTAVFPPLGVCHLVEVSACTPNYITFTGRVWTAPNQVAYNYQVSPTAPEGAAVTVHFRNGPCDALGFNQAESIEYLAPTITSVEIPTDEWHAGVQGRIIGTGFQAGSLVTCGGQRVFVGSAFVSSTRIDLTANNLAAGAASVTVTNPDGKVAGPFALAVTAEVAPDIDHAELLPDVSGSIGATLRIDGRHQNPPGAIYTFVGFNVTAVVRTLDNFLEFTGNVVAPAGNWITLDIASTANPGGYGPMNVVRASAPVGGAVIINSVGTPTAKDNQNNVLQVVEGENLDLIVLVETDVVDPANQNLAYIPSGAISPIDVTILSSTPDRLVLSMNVKRGLALNHYNLLFYGVGPVLLATAPSAFQALGSDTSAQISSADRLTLDAVFNAGGGALKVNGVNWIITVPVSGPEPWKFGDSIVATGFTLNSAVYVPGIQSWQIDGTNGALGSDWQIQISRPGYVPDEWTTYRFPGGTVT